MTGTLQGLTIVGCLFFLRCGLSTWHGLASPCSCCLCLPSAQLQECATLDTCFSHTSSYRGHTGTVASPLVALPETGLLRS